MKSILICMGSSCFARENRENLSFIENYLKVHKLEDAVRIEGSLCLGDCAEGPNLIINGTRYHQVDITKLNSILDQELLPV
jgi:NADH:ubiquinone oxidoreductase subunit E